jgi:hypothetical protein
VIYVVYVNPRCENMQSSSMKSIKAVGIIKNKKNRLGIY